MKQLNWKNLVPAIKHDAVQKAFVHAFGTIEIDSIEPLTGGRSSALVYKVTVAQKTCVLRIVMQVDTLTDPARQFICMNAAAKEHIAPPVCYTNAEDAVSIVDFIEHTPLSSQFVSDEELFAELATSIKAIHELPLFPELIGFLEGVDGLIERHHSTAVLPAEVTEEYFRYYDSIRRAYPQDKDELVSSHNDLNPGNVLHDNGKIWIIDWEVAFANDRYADLAIVNIFFGAGERGEETLLNTYFGESLSDYHRAQFFLMRQVCFMYYSMVFMWLAGISRTPDSVLSPSLETIRLQEFHIRLKNGEITMTSAEEYLMYAKILMNESLSQMKSARFEEAIILMESV